MVKNLSIKTFRTSTLATPRQMVPIMKYQTQL